MRLKRLIIYAVIGLLIIGLFVLFLLHGILVDPVGGNYEETDFRCYGCLASIAMTSPDEGWGLGFGRFILHYQNHSWRWERGFDSTTYVSSITSSSLGERWAVGDELWHYSNSSWTMVDQKPSADASLYKAQAIAASDVWGAGDSSTDGVIWHFDGQRWTQVYSIDSARISDLAFVSANAGWAVGTQYDGRNPKNGILLHYENGAWNIAATPGGALSAIALATPTDGWAVGVDVTGDGMFYHYDGATWTQSSSAPGVALSRISVASDGGAWALGHRGDDDTDLYHYTDGIWTSVPLPPGFYVRSISSIAAGDVWLLGETLEKDTAGYRNGVILHYQNGVWQTFRIPRRPPASEWDTPLRYATMAYLLLLVIPFAIGALIYSWRPTAGALWRNGIIRFLWIWLILFCLYVAGSLDLSILAPDVADALGGLALGVFIVLMFSIPAAMLFMIAFMREDGSFRWRRQT